jgi:predicted phosphodiesterase
VADMNFALLGDIHSSKNDLEKVLRDISSKSPDAFLVGTGDLFECTISKKNISEQKYKRLEDIMNNPEGFTDLLTFPSVKGNQEERILLITETDDPLREKLASLPETLTIENAEVIHGHQWKWGGNPWALLHANAKTSPTFYGHSHFSALSINGIDRPIEFGVPYAIDGEGVLVNVGSVIGHKEWVLFDTKNNTVTFMKA